MNLSIRRKLNKICKEINTNIIWPNAGGCGVIAERIYCFLKNHGIDCKIVCFTGDYKCIEDEIKNGLPVNGNSIYSRAHIVVKVGDQYIDSTGIGKRDSKICSIYPEAEVPFKFLVWWNLDKGLWNDMFDRCQIPLIDQIFFENT